MSKKSSNIRALIALVAGILILIFPNLLATTVAIFLILWAVLSLLDKN